MNSRWSLLVVSALVSTMLAGHPDLELQIEEVSQQISQTPADADLYLKRGDLYRRHREWERSRQDFEQARLLEPNQSVVDWYEGHLAVDEGQWAQGDRLLTRFLADHETQASAYHTRAWARWHLGQPEAAAQDYASAIAFSDRPAPTLYRSLVITQFASGGDLRAQAKETVDAGLQLFPGEASLLGLRVDLALAEGDIQQAQDYLSTVSPGILTLPQWTFRLAVLACLQGDKGSARELFTRLLPGPGNRAGSWNVPPERIEQLIADSNPPGCGETVVYMLEAQQP